jgi:uncharacterized DUF497 family protein
VEYEWDEAEAAANFAKHGVSFSAAARALEDRRKIEVLDDRFDYPRRECRASAWIAEMSCSS